MILAVWAVMLPLLTAPSATPDVIVMVDRHDHVRGVIPAGACDADCSGEKQESCPARRSCCRCLTALEHLVYESPVVADHCRMMIVGRIAPPDQAAPENDFQPPDPPPKFA